MKIQLNMDINNIFACWRKNCLFSFLDIAINLKIRFSELHRVFDYLLFISMGNEHINPIGLDFQRTLKDCWFYSGFFFTYWEPNILNEYAGSGVHKYHCFKSFFFSFHKRDIIKVDSGDKNGSYITEIDDHYIASSQSP